jgi:uncharacterized protein
MTEEILECLVRKALEAAELSCTFAFQGGEPVLAGLPFFKKLISLTDIYGRPGLRINYALQTNGTLIDADWAEFLGRNHFLTGLSLDGPRGFHDALRRDPEGRGTFSRVMETVTLFKRSRVEFNILCVVNGVNARHGELVYGFFRKNHFRYLQFIPCLDPWGEPPGGRPYSLTPAAYSRFLKTVFDLWYGDLKSGRGISIRYFDNLAGMILGYPPELCGMAGFCTAYGVVEAGGNVYPCDFYTTENYRLGNIQNAGFETLLASEAVRRFERVSRQISPGCGECKWYVLCRGGCRRNRETFTETIAHNYYCSAYKDFFTYAGPRLKNAAAILSSTR